MNTKLEYHQARLGEDLSGNKTCLSPGLVRGQTSVLPKIEGPQETCDFVRV